MTRSFGLSSWSISISQHTLRSALSSTKNVHIGDNYEEVLCFLELLSGSSSSSRYAGRASSHLQSEHLFFTKKKKKLALCSNPHFPSQAENKEMVVLKQEAGRRRQKSHQSKPPSHSLDTLAWRLWSELSTHGGLSPGRRHTPASRYTTQREVQMCAQPCIYSSEEIVPLRPGLFSSSGRGLSWQNR